MEQLIINEPCNIYLDLDIFNGNIIKNVIVKYRGKEYELDINKILKTFGKEK